MYIWRSAQECADRTLFGWGPPKIYGVAACSRLLKIIGLFCRISSLLQGSFTKETYNFKESTDRSHLIVKTLDFTGEYKLLKLYVSFAEYRLFYRALLQKRLITLDFTGEYKLLRIISTSKTYSKIFP